MSSVADVSSPLLEGLREIASKYQKQMLTPEDVAFVFYKARSALGVQLQSLTFSLAQVRDREEGNDDVTTMERIEAVLAVIMKTLAF